MGIAGHPEVGVVGGRVTLHVEARETGLLDLGNLVLVQGGESQLGQVHAVAAGIRIAAANEAVVTVLEVQHHGGRQHVDVVDHRVPGNELEPFAGGDGLIIVVVVAGPRVEADSREEPLLVADVLIPADRVRVVDHRLAQTRVVIVAHVGGVHGCRGQNGRSALAWAVIKPGGMMLPANGLRVTTLPTSVALNGL